jgi:[ribosomal protein S5]-alanine N-acetyltransferase
MSFESISKESSSLFVPNISTARLELVAVTPESILSEQAGDGRLGETLGCRVAAEWPPEDWEPHVFVWLLNRFAEDPSSIRWGRYILLRKDVAAPVLIGTVGAVPEFGYAVVPEFRRRGYALEAALEMIAWVKGTGEVTQLVAHTYPELAASIRILERCGFVLEGPGKEERTIWYRRDL